MTGTFQGITERLRNEIKASSSIRLPDPDRLSNTTSTTAIADAILRIAEGKCGEGGVFDLFNTPQWTWRDVYQFESQDLGIKVLFTDRCVENYSSPKFDPFTMLVRAAKTAVTRPVILNLVRRAIDFGPARFRETLKARYLSERVRREIYVLNTATASTNVATSWESIEARTLPGLTNTRELLDSHVFKRGVDGTRPWPADPP